MCKAGFPSPHRVQRGFLEGLACPSQRVQRAPRRNLVRDDFEDLNDLPAAIHDLLTLLLTRPSHHRTPMTSVQVFHPQIDIDLCYLLDRISLNGQDDVRGLSASPTPSNASTSTSGDINMPLSEQPVPRGSEEEHFGCGLLQAVQAQAAECQTTGPPGNPHSLHHTVARIDPCFRLAAGGEYLDVIFTHRELLFAYPAAHRACARGFSDLARRLEVRAWRADREGDSEAVVAFRNEAWMIAERWCVQ
ncbi:hypothetical protein NEOLEDRAFT_797687 [Neolentinus lepideus HHB14362 ss-1]|uniref:Uncharacterized protein n=1 Tax=Neolentinus lepideus HHB14362 ss-1 TaxID=1314782 RepID=A0A165PHB0_9AGAM|nr:hypothetical protein NEOLEDRAFT_797687 [Neolentinus lepideus HHB14362 ss-1]